MAVKVRPCLHIPSVCSGETGGPRQLDKLSENLKRIVNRELYTIENDTKIWSKRLSAAALKAWARPIVVGLLIFLGICGGSWGLTRWYSNRIQNLIERRDALTRQVEREQTRLDPPGAAQRCCRSNE